MSMREFLAALSTMDAVRPVKAAPLVVHADELEPVPLDATHNPTRLAMAAELPTTTFELFRQEFPPGVSSDMQRHHHETVHFVIAGHGHSVVEDETVTWGPGDFVYTPPWTWHRHFNDSDTEPAQMLGIESSRLLGLFGVNRRQSAGQVSVAEARAIFEGDRR
jgi:mannose-6-phosphate isomerase-like protein (cupin superfamily)